MARASSPLAWLAAGSLVLASAGAAQAQLLSGGEGLGDEPEKENPRGAYTGVKPGGSEKPAVPATAGTVPVSLTWPGFKMNIDGTSRVFVQTTAPVAVDSQVAPDKVVISFGDANIVGATNRLPLITKYFNTPVEEAELVRADGVTKMVIHLRAAATPKVSSAEAPSGFFFVYVDFPAGDFKPVDMPSIMPSPTGDTAPIPEGQVDRTKKRKPFEPPAPDHLEVDTSMDDELPPGMGELKGSAEGEAGIKLKKGGAKAEGKGKAKAKAGFSL